jgi:predicted acylesterase/phospholipase RssA
MKKLARLRREPHRPQECLEGGTNMYKLQPTGFFRKTRHLTSTAILTASDFDALAKELSVVPLDAQKFGFVAARRAERPERVETHSEGHETTNIANVGDWIITNMTPHGEALRDSAGRLDTYVIKGDDFERLYVPVHRQSEFGALYGAKGAVSAIELPGSFDILGPWNERQKGKAGYLIRNGDQIYGIEKSVFHRTYDIHGPGARKLSRPGKKRILALDGGGVRGMLTIGFLERLEDALRKQHGNTQLVLSDYFDMIGGTSVGAILATQLALGESVENVRRLFSDWCPTIFRRPAFWRQPQGRIPLIGQYLVPRFDARHLEKRLKQKLGDLRIGSPQLKTGLCIVTKRVDTGSPWVLTNNPRSKFWFGNAERVDNKVYPLADVVRASAAAPHYFKPHSIQIALDAKEKPGLFVDGGVSPYNNPALQMLMLAGIDGYGLGWPLGEDNLFIVSIGTGSYRLRSDGRGISAKQAVTALSGVIGDGEALTLTLLQWMSASHNAWKINSEIGDLSENYLGQKQGLGRPLLRFQRYDAPLEVDWLKDKLNLSFSQTQLDSLRDFTNPRNVAQLYDIGREAAKRQIQADHFPDDFKV